MTVNEANRKEKLLIILPGLSATPQQYMMMAIGNELVANGYDIFIADMYGSDKKDGRYPRSLPEITMQRHIEDLGDIVNHFSPAYSAVYAAAHSIAGRILLLADTRGLAKQVLLDPAGNYDSPEAKAIEKQYYKFSSSMNTQYIDWGDGIFMPAGPIVQELADTPFKVFEAAINNIKVNTLIIAAGHSLIGKAYKDLTNKTVSYIEVPGASHTFWEYGAAQSAAREILKFFGGK